jgi:hypothetical protein
MPLTVKTIVMTKRENISAAQSMLLLMILISVIIMKESYVMNAGSYLPLFIVVPLLLLAIYK